MVWATNAPASDHERVCPILHLETLRSRLPHEERVLSLDELGRELEFGVRQLEAESTSGSADLGAALQSSELAEHDDIIGIVPLEVRLQVAQSPETEVVFEHLVCWPHHLVLLVRQHDSSSRLDRTVTLHAVE
jgi:hypothetical protein